MSDRTKNNIETDSVVQKEAEQSLRFNPRQHESLEVLNDLFDDSIESSTDTPELTEVS